MLFQLKGGTLSFTSAEMRDIIKEACEQTEQALKDIKGTLELTHEEIKGRIIELQHKLEQLTVLQPERNEYNYEDMKLCNNHFVI